MNYLAAHENKTRGTFDFPIELHYVDPTHPRYLMPFHWHMESELIFVLSGTFSLALGTETYELHENDAIFIPEGLIHGGTPHGCVYECVVFDLAQFLQDNAIGRKGQKNDLSATVSRPHFFPANSPTCNIVDLLFETMEKNATGFELTAIGLLWQLMGALLQQAGKLSVAPAVQDKRTEQMKRVLRRIRRDYAEEITLDDLAAEAGMAPKYFCRAFKQITGRTPIDYLNYYRVECAGEWICVTSDSITNIALSCGFNDLSYFARAFRKYKGVSAQKYRQMQR